MYYILFLLSNSHITDHPVISSKHKYKLDTDTNVSSSNNNLNHEKSNEIVTSTHYK